MDCGHVLKDDRRVIGRSIQACLSDLRFWISYLTINYRPQLVTLEIITTNMSLDHNAKPKSPLAANGSWAHPPPSKSPLYVWELWTSAKHGETLWPQLHEAANGPSKGEDWWWWMYQETAFSILDHFHASSTFLDTANMYMAGESSAGSASGWLSATCETRWSLQQSTPFQLDCWPRNPRRYPIKLRREQQEEFAAVARGAWRTSKRII